MPIVTIWQGMTNGGAQLGPVMDTAKVALTQYEVIEITKVVVKTYSSGQVIDPRKFPDFIDENFYNHYSIFARQLKGDKSTDLT